MLKLLIKCYCFYSISTKFITGTFFFNMNVITLLRTFLRFVLISKPLYDDIDFRFVFNALHILSIYAPGTIFKCLKLSTDALLSQLKLDTASRTPISNFESPQSNFRKSFPNHPIQTLVRILMVSM